MNLRRIISACVLLLLAMGLLLGGCQKKEEAAQEQTAAQQQPAATPDSTMAADSTMATDSTQMAH
jgi:PBP1b-binding outer membrane lipoprotein LpoB